MRDISSLRPDIEKCSEGHKSLVLEINRLLDLYQREMEALEVVYDVMGAKPWYIDFDDYGNIIRCEWSDNYRKKLGFTDENDFPNSIESWIGIIVDDDREMVLEKFWAAIKDPTGKTRFDVKYRGRMKDGTIRFFRTAGVVRLHDNKSSNSFIGISYDDTLNHKNLSGLKEQYEIVEALSRDYLNVFMVDIPGKTATILKLDGYVTEGFGDKEKKSYPYEPFAAQYIKDRVYEEDRSALTKAMSLEKVKEMLAENDEYVMGYRAVDKGEIHYYQFTYLKLQTGEGEEKVIAGFKNIDGIVESAKERALLKELSERDSMTGILNRGFGEKTATQILGGDNKGMFCILDIDDFKHVNDTYGHNTGDKVIKKVATSLEEAFGEESVVFRLGGDEFAVLKKDVASKEEAKTYIDKFFDIIDHHSIDELKGSKFFASVGVGLFSEADKDFEELYKKVDSCVYVSKKTKGNILTFSE
ncbi:MAG: diguanylate cyclase [Lachnospiraceae bacterium]|nr:diguanylate cyclase [Lachnospiraceae bacterium]